MELAAGGIAPPVDTPIFSHTVRAATFTPPSVSPGGAKPFTGTHVASREGQQMVSRAAAQGNKIKVVDATQGASKAATAAQDAKVAAAAAKNAKVLATEGRVIATVAKDAAQVGKVVGAVAKEGGGLADVIPYVAAGAFILSRAETLLKAYDLHKQGRLGDNLEDIAFELAGAHRVEPSPVEVGTDRDGPEDSQWRAGPKEDAQALRRVGVGRQVHIPKVQPPRSTAHAAPLAVEVYSGSKGQIVAPWSEGFRPDTPAAVHPTGVHWRANSSHWIPQQAPAPAGQPPNVKIPGLNQPPIKDPISIHYDEIEVVSRRQKITGIQICDPKRPEENEIWGDQDSLPPEAKKKEELEKIIGTEGIKDLADGKVVKRSIKDNNGHDVVLIFKPDQNTNRINVETIVSSTIGPQLSDVRILNGSEEDAAAYRDIRLKALNDPTAMSGFATNVAVEQAQTIQEWQRRTRYEPKDNAVFTLWATVDGKDKIIACMTATRWPNDPTGQTVHWTGAYVDPTYRANRLGAILYQHRMEWSTVQGFTTALVAATDVNVRVQKIQKQNLGGKYVGSTPATTADGVDRLGHWHSVPLANDTHPMSRLKFTSQWGKPIIYKKQYAAE